MKAGKRRGWRMALSVGLVLGLAALAGAARAQDGQDGQGPADPLAQAEALVKEVRYEAARQVCLALLGSGGALEVQAQMLLARICWTQRQPGDAVEHARAAVAAASGEDGENLKAAAEQLLALYEAMYGMLQTRVKDLEAELAQAPAAQAADVTLRLADALVGVGRAQDAAARYMEVVKLAPDQSALGGQAAGRLLATLAGAGGLQSAAEALAKVQALAPGSAAAAAALYAMGQIYEQQGRADEALAAYEEVTKIGAATGGDLVPQSMAKSLGLLKATGRLDEAAQIAEQIIATYPASDAALMALGSLREVLDASGQTDALIQTLKDTTLQNPRTALGTAALTALGAVCQAHGRIEEALATVDQASAQYGEVPQVLYNTNPLAEICKEEGDAHNQGGDFAGAIALWEHAVALTTQRRWRAQVLFSIAVTYSELHEYEQGRGAARRILEELQSDTLDLRLAALEYIAGAYWLEGRLPDARETMDTALAVAETEKRDERVESIRGSIGSLDRALSSRQGN